MHGESGQRIRALSLPENVKAVHDHPPLRNCQTFKVQTGLPSVLAALHILLFYLFGIKRTLLLIESVTSTYEMVCPLQYVMLFVSKSSCCAVSTRNFDTGHVPLALKTMQPWHASVSNHRR